MSSSAPAGVSATRYSSVLISFATPILTAREPYLAVPESDTVSAQTRELAPLRSRWVVGSGCPVESVPIEVMS